LRTVVGNLQSLGFTSFASVELKFELVNRLGKPINLQTELQIFTQNQQFTTTTDEDGAFSIELLETSNIKKDVSYQVYVGEESSFNIHIPKGDTDIDILCLTTKIDYDGIVTITEQITGDVYVFDEKFIKKLDAYFKNKKQYLTHAEEKLIDKYCYIADIPAQNRCSDIDALDTYIATLLPNLTQG